METNYAIHWIEIYPVDSAIRRLNNLAQEPSNRLLTTGIFIIILCVTETLLFFLLDNFVFSYFWQTSFCNRFLNYLLRALKVFKSLKNLDCEQSLNCSSFESQLIEQARG